MLKRDPLDPRRRERLTGSYLLSLILHAIMAALVFTLATSSSQEGASESVAGGTVVTLEQRAPVVAVAAVPAQQAAPIPHVPHVAPVVHHAPLVEAKTRPIPPQHQELSTFAPSAPPNPTPLPQASLQPNVQPTTPVYEVNPSTGLPTVPTSVPSAPLEQVAIRPPPTAAPTPVPSVAPTAKPTPRPPAPTAAPTAKPATPKPLPSVRPTALPTTATVVANTSTVPSASPKPAGRPSNAPAANPGVPSPSPTQGAKLATTAGAAPSPGPKSEQSPGPKPGAGGSVKGAPAPVRVPPTPKPQPAQIAGAGSAGPGADINAKLRGLLPHNAVTYSQTEHAYDVAVNQSMDPTPPPSVLARTKFLYEERGSGSDARIKMWVTGTRRVGPALMCSGWLVRYPQASQPAFREGTMTHPVSGGIEISTNVGGSAAGGVLAPIVEQRAEVECTARALVPFAASSPSP